MVLIRRHPKASILGKLSWPWSELFHPPSACLHFLIPTGSSHRGLGENREAMGAKVGAGISAVRVGHIIAGTHGRLTAARCPQPRS